MKKWNPNLTVSETNELFADGFVIRVVHISPLEGYECMLLPMGGSAKDVIHTAKSPRACYSYYKKRIESR